jgi:hypothetical protein
MSLEIIGAGFGRTGTLSLKSALEELGFGPCHHMAEVIDDMHRQGPIWNSVANGKERNWQKVYDGYRATVDWPGCHYYAELADAFPEAKVILTERDSRSWYSSINETIFQNMPGRVARMLMAVGRFPMHFVSTILLKQTFRNDMGEANAIATFERHNAEVRNRIPADRLLVFDVKQGWEPLCAFLGVQVPDTPFPHTNDRQMFAHHGEKVREAFRRRKTA